MDGKSVYELAVERKGFDEESFLVSLAGMSYELAQQEGYVGDLSEWRIPHKSATTLRS